MIGSVWTWIYHRSSDGRAAKSMGYAVPAFAAAAISLINLILIYAWLPESLTKRSAVK